MTANPSVARINIHVRRELKQTVEDAAVTLGQTMSEFVVSTVVREARQVLRQAQVTRLTNRDRDRFLEALDAIDTKPNAALQAAARRYVKRRA